jgi:hypothetical protein
MAKISFKTFELRDFGLKKKKNYETACGYVICAFSRIGCVVPLSVTK